MTSRATKRAEREELAQLRETARKLEADNTGLLDLLNAVLFAAGGRIIVSRAQLIAADRRQIQVHHGPDAIIIETEKRNGDMRSITERLWLPNQ